jgi:ADP-ribose pyrophosphatase YjhB (NUDIX family)
VAIWHDQKILVIKNSYKKRYTLPCGRLKSNENALDAAVRELYEEVNIKLDASQLLFVGKYIGKYKYVADEGHFFEIVMAQMPEVQVDDREVIWARFLSVEDTMKLKLNPAVRSYLNDRYKR